jgi:hypothetical protein
MKTVSGRWLVRVDRSCCPASENPSRTRYYDRVLGMTARDASRPFGKARLSQPADGDPRLSWKGRLKRTTMTTKNPTSCWQAFSGGWLPLGSFSVTGRRSRLDQRRRSCDIARSLVTPASRLPATSNQLSAMSRLMHRGKTDCYSIPGLKWSSQHFEGEVAMTTALPKSP